MTHYLLRPAVLVFVIVLAGCGSPGTVPTATETASASPVSSTGVPEATPSVSEAPSPSASASPRPAGQLEVDGLARTTVDGLRIREDPGTGSVSLGTVIEGEIGYVVDGPVSADGFDWYLLSALGLPMSSGCITPIDTTPFNCPVWFGWAAAEGSDGDAWLVPGEIACPEWPNPAITDDFVFGVPAYGYLACFGDEARTVVGFYPEIPEDAGLGGACAGVPTDMAWITCNLGYEQIVGDPAAGFFGAGLPLAIDPATVEMPARGQWIEITGRYGHPAAQECTWGDPPEETILGCRAQFVVESAQASTAP